MPIINSASPKSLSAVFDKANFSIPRYQRAYSWDESNWKELWDDINKTVISDEKELFLGAIIYYHADSAGSSYAQYSIIDGQQRITTITILMRVLYEKLKSLKNDVYTRFGDELYEKYIGDKNKGSLFLKLSKKDQSFFYDYIQKEEPNRKSKGKIISNKNIRKCYEYFSYELEKFNSGNHSQFGELCYGFKKKIENNLTFVIIDVNTDVDAYIIFESINSKQKNLTTSDLLKNYLLLSAERFEKNKPDSKKLSVAEDGWEKIEQTLDKIEVNQYIRHFWISNYGKVSEKELYQKIKNEFKSNDASILSFLENLVDEVESYSSIVNAALVDFPQEGIRALEQLKYLRNRQYYPLILSAISSNLDSKDISKLICQIASVAVRRALVGKNPNELEGFFVKKALELRKRTIVIADVIREMGGKDYWISDEDIIQEISKVDFQDQEYLAKFILKEFEISRTQEMEKIISKISLEHILPRNPENLNDWIIDENRHQELVWNIGNLALIGPKYNSKMSNKNFTAKRPWLAKSEIKTTVEISNCEIWSESEILKRNLEIGSFIVKWWKNIS